MRKKYVRVGFTAAQSSELWDRWQKGEGLESTHNGHSSSLMRMSAIGSQSSRSSAAIS